MDTSEIAMGLIMMSVIGPAIGNYATSVVYRLPLGQTPFEKHPYCGDCGAMLSPRDLFPIWSYVFLRGRCRHCGVPIRPSYTVIEITCGLLFICNFLVFGLSEAFILLTALGVFWVMLAALDYHEARLYPIILTFCFALAAMARLIRDDSIYPMVQSGFLMLFASMLCWRLIAPKAAHSPEATCYRLPSWAVMAALAGTCMPLSHAAIAMAIAGGLYGMQRAIWGWRIASLPTGIAVWVTLLYSQMSSSL